MWGLWQSHWVRGTRPQVHMVPDQDPLGARPRYSGKGDRPVWGIWGGVGVGEEGCIRSTGKKGC